LIQFAVTSKKIEGKGIFVVSGAQFCRWRGGGNGGIFV
jgi:hypothetical protein